MDIAFISTLHFMNASTLSNGKIHVAIVMDGNGRWATARGKARVAGHQEGARAVRRVVEAAPGAGVGMLTLYAFSSDNWKRPEREVNALMRLFRRYLASESNRLRENGVRLTFIGRRDRLAGEIVRAMEAAEAATADGRELELRLAVDYSSRDAIVAAADQLRDDELGSREGLSRALARVYRGAGAPDVDLLVRTGGEQRLSDFMLWECAYAELYFTERMWPEFGAEELEEAVAEFRARTRRFGALPEAVAG